MKVLIFTSDIEQGGIAQATNSYLEILNKIKSISLVDLAVIEAHSIERWHYETTFIFCKPILDYKCPLFNKVRRIVRTFLQYHQILKLREYDVVLTLNLEPNFIALLHNYLFFSKTKIVTSDHTDLNSFYKNGGALKKIFKIVFSILYSTVEKSIGCSESVSSSLKASYGLSSTKVATIYNTLRSDLIDLKPSSSEIYFCAVGRLVKEKGFRELIFALGDYLIQNAITLKIIGDGPEKNHLQKIISENNLGSHIELLGYVKNPSLIVSGAEIFLSSSKQEGFGLSILEAMKQGIPAISTDCNSGPREIIAPDSDISFRLTKSFEVTPYGILIPSSENFPSFKEGLIGALNALQLQETKNRIKYESIKRAEDFSPTSITHKWNILFQDLAKRL